MALLGQVPPSSLVVGHSNGRGVWARDLEIISLPHLLHHFDMVTQMQHFCSVGCGCPLSRISHPHRTGRGHAQRQMQAWQAWEPGQAQGSSSSDPKAIAQPMASQGESQPMASGGKAKLGSLSKWTKGTCKGWNQIAVPPRPPALPAPPRAPPRHPPPPPPPSRPAPSPGEEEEAGTLAGAKDRRKRRRRQRHSNE